MTEGCTLFVGNLPFKIGDDELFDYFKSFGSVSDARVSRERETHRSRGFGYVTFESEGEAQAAIERANGSVRGVVIKDLLGRSIRVEASRPREPREGGRSGGYQGGRERNDDRRERSNWRDDNRQGGRSEGGRSGGYQGGRYQEGGYDQSGSSRPRGGGRYRDDNRSGGGRDRNYDRGYRADY